MIPSVHSINHRTLTIATILAIATLLGATTSHRSVHALTVLSGCQEIVASGDYVLSATGTFSSGGDCFLIQGRSNVTLNGNGQIITAARAVSITSRSVNVAIRNFQTSGDITVSGSPGVACGTTIPENIVIENVTLTAGSIDVDGACGVTIQNNSVGGAVGVSNAYVINSVYNIINNTIDDNLWVYNTRDVTVENNTISGPAQLMADAGPTTNATFRNNSIISNEGYLDTNDVLRIRGVRSSVFDRNYVESLVPNASVVVKLYDTRSTSFTQNTFVASGAAPTSGAVMMRSSTTDNTFFRNTILAAQATSVGIMSHFSNIGCDITGNFPPPGTTDCRETGYDPTKYCGDPSHPNYRAPFTEACHNRRNVFSANTVIAGSIGVWHYGDGRENVYRNNVIVAATGVSAEHCEAPGGGAVSYFNNTISASGTALSQGTDCLVQARNSIFHSSGATSVGQVGGFSGEYNLYHPAYSGATVNDRAGDPRFVDLGHPDPFQRNYRLQSNSPAVNAGDPSSEQAPIGADVDIENADRPYGGGYDIGAYEYGATTPSCIERWQCAAWSSCANGQQTRACTDINACGTTALKPPETVACTTSCAEQWSCGSWSDCTNRQQTRGCVDQNACGTTALRPALNQACSAGTQCGADCAGCTANHILVNPCSTPRRQCDGTNAIEDIRLSTAVVAAGGSLTVDLDYSCWPADPAEDNVALWYWNGSSWRLIDDWPAPLQGCDTTPGTDGTFSVTFRPDTTVGTHVVRAIQSAGNQPSDPRANSSFCPDLRWGNIDDLAFSVQAATGCVEQWSCSLWSACTNGQQTRTCTDVNACGSTAARPPLSQTCSCNENWQCDAWSVCLNGQQTRTCTDVNACGSTANLPAMQRVCPTGSDIVGPAPIANLRAR